MINLIPNEERKKMIRDFYFRLVVVFFFAFAFSMVIASVSLLPAYFMSTIKLNSVLAKLQIQEKEPVPEVSQKTQGVIKDVNTKLGILDKAQKTKFLLSERVINEVVSRKMEDIKIKGITFEDKLDKGRKITIMGTAPSRERLLMFRQALEDDKMFSRVDLPISNFVKGADIEFSLNLIPS